MSSVNYSKEIYFDYYNQKDLNKLTTYKTTGKDAEKLRLNLRDCERLNEVFETFPNIKSLDFSIWNYNEDMKKEVKLPHLRKVHFGKLIPMHFKNFWKIFINLEEISIGNYDNYDVFTSEFVNRVIGRNEKTLKVLRLLDIPLVTSTFRRLRVPCQLEELEIIFFREDSKEKICRSERHRQNHYEKQKFRKQPGLIFYTMEDEIKTFDNLKDIIKSQNSLKTIRLDYATVNQEMLDIISSKSSVETLKICSSELNFSEFSVSSEDFFRKLKTFIISHVPENSSTGFRKLLENLRDVEVLEINCIWPETTFVPLENKIVLKNLKELTMHLNNSCNEIFKSFQFTDKFERLTSYGVQDVATVEEILRTSPNMKYCYLDSCDNVEVPNFVIRNFKKLEWFEMSLREFSFDTVIYVLENASHIKIAKIHLYNDYSREDESKLDEELKRFPGFYFDYRGCTLEIHNKELDFKLRVGYHHFMLGGNW